MRTWTACHCDLAGTIGVAGPPLPRQCGRCRLFFAGDPTDSVSGRLCGGFVRRVESRCSEVVRRVTRRAANDGRPLGCALRRDRVAPAVYGEHHDHDNRDDDVGTSGELLAPMRTSSTGPVRGGRSARACWKDIDGKTHTRTDRRAEVRADRAASKESHDETDGSSSHDSDPKKMGRVPVRVACRAYRHRGPPFSPSSLGTSTAAQQRQRSRLRLTGGWLLASAGRRSRLSPAIRLWRRRPPCRLMKEAAEWIGEPGAGDPT